MTPMSAPEDDAWVETLGRRLQTRVSLAVSLARAYRFALELEPFSSSGRDPFKEAEIALRAWRQALRNLDAEAALDAMERTWPALEACRARVIARDAAVEAFRVRWACENAPLRHQTVDALARFYRLLPVSRSSQSKYEYVLTRRLAGPVGPERQLASTEELTEAVRALEASWGATPVVVDEVEVAMAQDALRSFTRESASQPDAACFTSSAVLRRFGAFKASIGEKLFDPRLSAAVVETNVAILNDLNRLLTDAGGQPIRGRGTSRATGPLPRPRPAAAMPPPTQPEPPFPAPISLSEGLPVEEGGAVRTDAPSVDWSGHMAEPFAELVTEPGSAPEMTLDAPATPSHEEAASLAKRARRPDIKTGEVDLSGLELEKLRERLAAATAEGTDAVPPGEALPEEPTAARPPVPIAHTLENSAIIERYLAGPRSVEVFRLDLDFFLAPPLGVSENGNQAADRRRALELMLDSDDLIRAIEDSSDGPSAEHRSRVRAVASAMLLLRASLRRAADSASRTGGEAEPLLYVADHLLWERLRLESSLKRRRSRQRPQALPKLAPPREPTRRSARGQRDLRFLVRALIGAVAIATLVALNSLSVAAPPVDPSVAVVEMSGLPGAAVFDEARAYRTTLFVSATQTWLLLGREERRAIVRGLGAFAAERGLDAVSVIGPRGQPWATFKDDEVMLDGDPPQTDSAPL